MSKKFQRFLSLVTALIMALYSVPVSAFASETVDVQVVSEEVHTCEFALVGENAPTCTEAGSKTYACSCGNGYSEEISAIGHSYSETVTAPTCTADGSRVMTCSTCGDTVTETISATGHSYSSAVTTEATCAQVGVITYTCSACNDSYTEEIPMIDHSYETVTVDATCTEAGKITSTCTVCGAVTEEEIPALEHNFEEDLENSIEATCTEEGSLVKVCTVCGEIETEVVEMAEHEYVDGFCVACGQADLTAVVKEGPAGVLSSSLVDLSDPAETFITAEITGLNATESVVIKLYDANGVHLATTTLLKPEYFTTSPLGVKIIITGDSSSWSTVWEADKLRADYVPAYAELYVDGVLMNQANVPMVSTNGEAAVNWAEVPGVPAAPLADPVAMIGDQGYASLQEALDAAKGESNIVINLMKDATLDITAWQTLAIGGDATETITINGNDHKLTFNQLDSDWNNVATNNAKLILKNMTIANSGHNDGPWNRYDINFACDVELNNVTSERALAFKAGATLKNVVINESEDVYAIWIQPNGQNVTIDGLTINSAGRGIKIDDEYVDNPEKVDLIVNDATFSTAKKAAIMVKSAAGAKISVSDVDISKVAADSTNVVWNDEDAVAAYGEITVTGGTLGQEGNFPAVLKDANGNVKGFYKTLPEAVTAAQPRDTVVLLESITADTAVDGTDVIIDLNTNTLTLTVGGNNFFGTSTIKNGTIDITGCIAEGDCIIGIGDYSNDATLTLDDVNIYGDGYSSAYAVLYVYNASTLNINGGSVVVSNEQYSAGGVIKAEQGIDGKINIVGTESDPVELTFNNAKIGMLDGTVLMEYVDLDITGGANAINQSALTVKNSSLTIKDCDGRALTLNDGDVTIENSTLDFSGATEGEIRYKKALTLKLVGDTDITGCDIWSDVAGAKVIDADDTEFTVSGTEAEPNIVKAEAGQVELKEKPKGTITYGYTGQEGVWGEGGGNAKESLEVELYVGDTKIATASLNNIGGIIDGDVYVTWSIPFAGSTDAYWTVEWAEGYPSADAQPTKVVMIIDGEKVAENDVVMNAPDNLNPVVWKDLLYFTPIEVTYPVGNPVYPEGKVEYYSSILEAVPYTTNCPRLEGATVKLLRDIEDSGIRMMENDMVLDLNDFTYTITAGTGSQGTNTSGFQIRQEITTKATIKNGTINVAEGAPVVWMFNVYATDFVVEDVTVDCANMPYSAYGESCYVSVSRAGDNVQFLGNTKFVNFNADVAGNAVNVGDTMTIADTVDVGGTIELDAGAKLTAKEGLTVVAANEGYAVGYSNGVYTVFLPTVAITDAEGNVTYFATIAEAMKAAQRGDEVFIYAGDYTGGLNVNKAITVVGETDAEGNNLVNISGKLSISGSNVTVKNLNVSNPSGDAAGISGGNILVEGCQLTGSNGLRYCYANDGDVTLKDCVITGAVYGVHFDGGNDDGDVIIDGCTITGWTSFGSAIEEVSISNTEFKDGSYDKLRFYQNAEVTNCTFPESMSIDFGVDNTTAEFNSITVEGGKELTDILYIPDIVNMGIEAYEDGVLIVVEATVTDSTGAVDYFLKLTEAVEAAQEGDLIEMQADVKLDAPIALGNNVTLSLNGKKLTGNVVGKLAMAGGTYITAEGHNMVAPTDAEETFHYLSDDGVFVIEANGDITFAEGDVKLGESWRTLPGQKVTVAEGAIFTVPAGMKFEIRGNATVNGTLTIEETGEVVLADASATLTAEEGLNVTTSVADYKVVYEDGMYKLVAIVYVAEVTNNGVTTKYESLQAALDAAEGETDIVIELLADATLDITAWDTLAIGGETTETITINGNGNKLTFNQLNSDWNNVSTNNNAKLILNDMTIANSGHNNGPWNRYDINFGCDVELNNVTSDRALAFKAGAVLKDVTINESGDNYAIWIQANGQTVSIDGLNVASAGRGIKIDEQYVDAAKVDLTVKDATFDTQKKGAIMVKSAAGADIALENVDISNAAADTVNAVWNDEDAAAYFGKVSVTGGTLVQEGDFVATLSDADGKIQGYYKTLQAALDACTEGDNTVTLLADLDEDVTIKQVVGVNVTIDGADKIYTGTMINDSGSRQDTAETLTIKNVNFETAESEHTFIDFSETKLPTRYPHNVAVENCTFTATDAAVNTAVAMRFAQGKNISVSNCTAEGLHSAIQASGDKGLVVDDLTVTGCKNGIAVGTSTGVVVKNSNITTTGYGIRADGSGAYDMTVEGCTIESNLPIVVRKNTGAYQLTVNGSNSFTAKNEGGYQVIFTNGDDGEYVVPTGAYVYTPDDANSELVVYPDAAYVAQIGETKYISLAEAVAAAEAGDTITVIAPIELTETVTVDKEVTLDLNGQEITADVDNLFGSIYVNKTGNLTVKDETGEGKITNTAGTAIGNYGIVTVEGGTIAAAEDSAALYNFNYQGELYGTSTIAGGTMESPVWNCGVMTITGGTLNDIDNSGKMDITGEEVLVEGTIIGQDGTDAPGVEGAGTLTITAGTYHSDPTEWVAEGYVAEDNGDGTWTVKEDDLFDIYASNIKAGDSLDMSFFVYKSDLEGEDYYAQVTRSYAPSSGKADHVVLIPYSEWGTYGSTSYRFTYPGIAAKEMTDVLTVQIFHGDGTEASHVRSDSVRDYACRAIVGYSDNAELVTALVDMLNYGTENQKYFNYHMDDLANGRIDEHQVNATPSVEYADYREKSESYYGTSVSTESQLILTFYFKNIDRNMQAKVNYTDHYGNKKSVVIDGSEFWQYNSTTLGARVTGLAAADGRAMISCEIVDDNGEVVAWAKDSIESVAARSINAGVAADMYTALMKFVQSAYNYFH